MATANARPPACVVCGGPVVRAAWGDRTSSDGRNWRLTCSDACLLEVQRSHIELVRAGEYGPGTTLPRGRKLRRMVREQWAADDGTRRAAVAELGRRTGPANWAAYRERIGPEAFAEQTARGVAAAAAKRRGQRRCKRGHPLVGPEADVHVDPRGSRVCRPCRRLHERRKRKRRKRGA